LRALETGWPQTYNEKAMANPQNIKTLSQPAYSQPPPLPRGEHLPVTVIAVPVKPVRPDAGLSRLFKHLSSGSILPVVSRKKRLVGIIRDQDVLLTADMKLAAIRADGVFLSDEPLVVLSLTDTLARAHALFSQMDRPYIPIVDAKGRYTGKCASRLLLNQWLDGALRPTRVGGLATPLGVYMTSGHYSAGAGLKGLVATGVLFAVLAYLFNVLGLVFYSAIIALWPNLSQMNAESQSILQLGILLFLMLGLLRLSPMSGLHAAEHMTINALESGLELTPRTVRMQPREHLRCGTNLSVLLAGVEVGVLSVLALAPEVNIWGLGLYTAFWAFLIIRFWQPAGLWIQRYFTTKPPSPAQLASGIKAGRELLEKFSGQPHPVPSFWRRLWGSGLPILAASFLITAWILSLFFGKIGL
jgi:hypothetical protein